MKKSIYSKILLAILALVMVVSMLPVAALAAPGTYVLNPGDMATVPNKGDKEDGDTDKVGTDEYFAVFYSAKTRVVENAKTFDDGFVSTKRIDWGGGTVIGETTKNAIRIKTEGPATVKFWWGCGGDTRQVAVYNEEGQIVVQTNIESKKNILYISELEIPAAGTYYIGNVPDANGDASNYYYQISVTEAGNSKPTGDNTMFYLFSGMTALVAIAALVLLRKKETV